MNFHEYADENGEVLILRRIPQDRTTYGSFKWPSGIGTHVECADWEATPKCGHGLHGWPWGFGLGDGCDYDIIDDIWLVVGAKPKDVVGEVGGGPKCKFCQGTIRLEGTFQAAMDFVQSGFRACVAVMAKENGKRDSSKAAASGDFSTAAASGDSSKAAASGNFSTAAASGDCSKAAASGDSSKAAASGNFSTAAASGDCSKAAASGDCSKAAASGDCSTAAASGDYSQCEAIGRHTCAACVGNNGRIRVGERGAFAIAYFDVNDGWRFLIGKVGEDGIKADTWYQVESGRLVECEGA